jgi:hypothetical protein
MNVKSNTIRIVIFGLISFKLFLQIDYRPIAMHLPKSIAFNLFAYWNFYSNIIAMVLFQ